MEKNVLFISKEAELCQKFADKAAGTDWKTDTAVEGLAAAEAIKTKDYQVVITGMLLKPFDGERIITWLNKAKPDTVIIVYTKVISPAQLFFLYNERNVYRIYLKPKTFDEEFMNAIEAGIELSEAKKLGRTEKEEQFALAKKQMEDLSNLKSLFSHLEESEKGYQEFKSFIMHENVSYLDGKYKEEEQKQIIQKELELLQEYQVCQGEPLELVRMKTDLEAEFPAEEDDRFVLLLPQLHYKYQPSSVEKLRYLLSVFLINWKDVFGSCRVNIVIENKTGSVLGVTLRFEQYEEDWEKAGENPVKKAFLDMSFAMAKSLGRNCKQIASPNTVTYTMEMEMERA